LAGLAVDLHADVHLGAVARLGGAGEALLHRLDDEAGVDHLRARHRLGGLQQLELVGGCDGHLSQSSWEPLVVGSVSSVSSCSISLNRLSSKSSPTMPAAFLWRKASRISSSVRTS